MTVSASSSSTPTLEVPPRPGPTLVVGCNGVRRVSSFVRAQPARQTKSIIETAPATRCQARSGADSQASSVTADAVPGFLPWLDTARCHRAAPRLVANTVALDGSIPSEEVLELIDHSFALACKIEGADC